MQKKTVQLSKSLFAIIKKSCRSEYEWIESHGSISDTDGNIQVEIKPEFQDQAQQRLQEFEICADRESGNTRDFFKEQENKQQSLNNKHMQCLMGCSKDLNADDDFITRCFSNCYTETFNELDSILENTDRKFDDLLRKF